jgi:hypothetical protein
MKLHDCVKLGLNHHLLFSSVIEQDSRAHVETLKILESDSRFDVLDMWVPEDEPYRTQAIDLLRNSDKEVFYNCGNRAGKPSLAPASFDVEKRKYTLNVYLDELDRAKAIGATKVITNSGPNSPDRREEAFNLIVEFYCTLCRAVPDMLVMVEPTDWDVSKKKLIGSSAEAVEVCRRVRAAGCGNMASMVDMCHIPLMHETLAQAMADTGEFLGHIHLGNSILNDREHPFFGDKHVPIGINGGEYNTQDVAELFRLGLASGYFSNGKRGSASIEIRTMPGDDPAETLDRCYGIVCDAWELAVKDI